MIQSVWGATIATNWLRERLSLVILLAVVAALGLIGALASGWNSPRPGTPPDWEALTLPRRVEVGPDETYLSLLGHLAADYTFEVIVLPPAEPSSGFYDFGLVYRAQDDTRYYAFVVGTDGYYAVVRMEGDQRTVLVPWQQFPHIRRGRQWNRLLVTCTGPVCVFRINDEHAATVEDDRWLSGDVGLWVRSSGEQDTVQFNAARMWMPDD